MNLSADHYASIVQTLQDNGPRGDADKRRARRVVHRARVPVLLDHNTDRERTTTVTVRDLSPRGIGLLHTERVPRGTTFVLRIDRRNEPSVRVLCTVAHCRLQPGGVYSIGAEFTCVLGAEPVPTGKSVQDDLERIRRSVLA